MSAWLADESTPCPRTGSGTRSRTGTHHGVDVFTALRDQAGDQSAQVTAAGAAWLAGASAYPRSTLAQWEAHPGSPGVLPCGSAFDVVNVPALFGRRMLEHLWADGPGSGPVATHRGRMLLFAAPGTAQRLPSLLDWEEWGGAPRPGEDQGPEPLREAADREGRMPPLLCHGTGDAVTVPPLACGSAAAGPRWVVAPDTRNPWLPGPDVLLWACVRVTRSTPPGAVRISIFPPADQGANVYDVSRRR
ncbi:bifunctional DNA primase/polymerase [Streptomyces sp. NPDC058231]|uniref:bifunctional DNA primase/polymerase n=1 Tax=Streptomyces sp. NPDC058231 TaxID=3346392 RepID=UPI0036EC50FF